MRWDQLFADLAAQLAADEALGRASEVSERTRLERATIRLSDRLTAWTGQPCALHIQGSQQVAGMVIDSAQDWVLVDAAGPVLVPMAAVVGVSGLGAAAAVRSPGSRQLGLGVVLRAIARDRSPVLLATVDEEILTGTIDTVGADYLDLAEHPVDLPRRSAAVRATRAIAWSAVAWVRPARGTSSLLD